MKVFNQKIAYFSTYPPRECGIATYCQDLMWAINEHDQSAGIVIAINNGEKYNYPPEVKFTIDQSTLSDYKKAALWVNKSDIDLVMLQFEFGILGSRDHDGEYILEFLRNVKKPVVTTYHTVLSGTNTERMKTVNKTCDLSVGTIVMLPLAKKYLTYIYDADPKKITIIHHGVPDIGRLESTAIVKEELGFQNRIVLSTFGLVNTGKGIEFVIQALPKIKEQYPNILFLVLGQTHPQIKKRDGEAYREFLESEVRRLGLEKNVIFVNKYLSKEEIIKYLRSTDIYITSYLEPQQITSGALAYAIGAGRPIISTRYIYAKQMITKDRGLLVDFKNSEDMAKKVNQMLADPVSMKKMAAKNYQLGRQMVWSAVAKRHLRLMRRILYQPSLLEQVLWHKPKQIVSKISKVNRILDISKK